MTQTANKKKKTGPKPRYGEAKTMVSFRLSPEALTIIKALAGELNISQAEVLERWAREFSKSGSLANDDSSVALTASISGARAASERESII